MTIDLLMRRTLPRKSNRRTQNRFALFIKDANVHETQNVFEFGMSYDGYDVTIALPNIMMSYINEVIVIKGLRTLVENTKPSMTKDDGIRSDMEKDFVRRVKEAKYISHDHISFVYMGSNFTIECARVYSLDYCNTYIIFGKVVPYSSNTEEEPEAGTIDYDSEFTRLSGAREMKDQPIVNYPVNRDEYKELIDTEIDTIQEYQRQFIEKKYH